MFSILAVAGAIEVCDLGELEPSCLLQTPSSPASLLATESGASASPILLCDPGTNCRCSGSISFTPSLEQPLSSSTFLQDCNALCFGSSQPSFQTDELSDGTKQVCFCCGALSKTDVTSPTLLYQVVVPPTTTTTSMAAVYGDPHIKTLDGRRYTLLTQGTFSLWHYWGVEAELPWRKKVPIDWQLYTHYSGHQSFTKGLLLVDKTGGSSRQVLEITADDCQWRARKGNDEWTPVKNEEVVAVPDGNDYVSGFIVTKKEGSKGHNHVLLNMQTKDGKADVAVLSVSCRPKHHLNLQMVMKQRSDAKFIDGQLKPARNASLLQTSSDSDFSIKSTWQNLGGSAEAAAYFRRVDENQPHFSLLAICSEADEDQAKETCSKHLGPMEGVDEAFLKDCISDVCHGAGETAAELAAELLASTRAIGIH